MSDEINDVIDDGEEEVTDTEVLTEDVKVSDVPNSSGEEEEDGEAVVNKVKADLGLAEESKQAAEETKDIPDAFTEAALANGWTTEDIKEFAKDMDDDLLIELIPELLEDNDNNKEETSVEQKKEEKKTQSSEKPEEKPDSAELAAVKKELAEIRESLKDAQQIKDEREHIAMVNTVEQAFDEASENFEIFGKTEELLKYPAGPRKGQFVPTSPAMKARDEVWQKALPFIKSGIPVKDAMEIGITWYKGANLEKDVQRNYIKDMKKHETKLSAKRSGKRTVKTYEDEDEMKADVVREAARKAGVRGEYGKD